MTDVRLFHTDDGGDIEFLNGRVTLADGLETAAYLSLFGGNERDSGIDGDDPLQWWGNIDETEVTKKYRSETQYLIRSIPAIPANLVRIREAAARDLAWFTDELADDVAVEVTIPALNRIQIDVEIQLGDTTFVFVIAEDWVSP